MDGFDEEEITRMKRAFMKKILFWVLLIPICMLITFITIPTAILARLDNVIGKYSHRFESWCFDDDPYQAPEHDRRQERNE